MTTYISVTSGVTSSGLIISSGVELDVLSGGIASGIIISGGYEHVYAGGLDSGGTVENGGILDDYGSAYNTNILSGGAVGVGNGSTASIQNATVGTGGTLNIYAQGNSNEVTVSGGTENIYGGFMNFGTIEAGGAAGATSGAFVGADVSSGGTFNLFSGVVTQPPFFVTVLSGGTVNSSTGTSGPVFNNGGTINPLCFAAGTHIQTEHGFVPVEDLVVGDRVSAHFAGVAPVSWIGRRTIDCRRHARPEGVWPVRVRAGAFGEGVPLRDVLLSPDHAVFVGEVLVPVRELVDGGMIVQERVDSVTYYHVELAQHDVLFADGLPAESYLDTGNRANFQGEAGVIALHPEFAALSWDALGCAPLVLAGPELEAARRMVVRVDEPEWAQGIAATA
jgi:autotransporter passenger strand-loop-strand repeat protein